MQKLLKLYKTYATAQNALFILAVIIGLSIVFDTFKIIRRNYELQKQVDTLAAEVALIEVENQNARYNIEYYKTDDYLEIEAKRRLNLVEKGEKVALLEKNGDPVAIETPGQQANKQDAQETSSFKKWMTFLAGGGF